MAKQLPETGLGVGNLRGERLFSVLLVHGIGVELTDHLLKQESLEVRSKRPHGSLDLLEMVIVRDDEEQRLVWIGSLVSAGGVSVIMRRFAHGGGEGSVEVGTLFELVSLGR